MNTYIYRRPFRRATYRLSEDGVEFESKIYGRSVRSFVTYEKITHRSSTIKYSSKWLKWISIFTFFFTALFLISSIKDQRSLPMAATYGIIFSFSFILFLLSRGTSEVFGAISFFRAPSTEQNLREFLSELENAKVDFFERRLRRRTDEFGTYDTTKYLLYLLESGIIGEKDYDKLRACINSMSIEPEDER